MSEETVVKYNLSYNPERFKEYQYYISRDIVLIYYYDEPVYEAPSGRTYTDTGVKRDIRQILSSTPGVARDYEIDETTGIIRLGIAFEEDDNKLLWFAQDPEKEDGNFYLAYADTKTGEVSYEGRLYVVSYEKPSGPDAYFVNMFLRDRTEGKYKDLDPMLLYAKTAKKEKTEVRKTFKGRKVEDAAVNGGTW